MENMIILNLVKQASKKDLSLEIMEIDGGIHIQLNDNMGSIYSSYSTSLLEALYNIELFIKNYGVNNKYIDNIVCSISSSLS